MVLRKLSIYIYKLCNNYPLLHEFLELVKNFHWLFNSQQILGTEERFIEYTVVT